MNTLVWKEERRGLTKTQSTKDGEPRSPVPEESFESEEVWHKVLII